jgi:predicted AlkP superfamily pyrophosphatase or phosphodiesterase
MGLDVAEHLRLGKAASTDMLAIGFSTLDKVGHDFGPNSHEIQDIMIRLDRTLGEFLTGLDRLVGAGNYTLALSADHGVAPIPERSQREGIDAGRVFAATLLRKVEETLSNAFGPGHYVDQFLYTDLYLAPGVYEKLRDQPSALRSVRDAIRSLPGIQDVYTRDELVANRFDDDPMGRRFAHSYYPGRSGDLLVMVRPYWMVQAAGTTHGTGYDYDTHVPVMLMGKGIVQGEFLTAASPIDIAPTLAFLAGVTLPRPSGRVLAEALTAPDKAVASHPSANAR